MSGPDRRSFLTAALAAGAAAVQPAMRRPRKMPRRPCKEASAWAW